MIRLLKIEWLKLAKYPAFWLLIFMVAASYPGINAIFLNVYKQVMTNKKGLSDIMRLLIGRPFAFPEVWRTTAYFSSWFVVIPAVLVIMMVTNEYTFRTHRQNIIDGWSRTEFISAKLLGIVLLTVIITCVYAVTALLIGYQYSEQISNVMSQKSYYIGLFSLQTFYHLSIAFVLGLLIRKSFLALGVFLFYSVIVEPIAINFLKFKYKLTVGDYFPFEIADKMIPPPAFLGNFDPENYQAALAKIPMHVGLTFALSILLWTFAYRWYQKLDL